jgi:hypothetical protein
MRCRRNCGYRLPQFPFDLHALFDEHPLFVPQETLSDFPPI